VDTAGDLAAHIGLPAVDHLLARREAVEAGRLHIVERHAIEHDPPADVGVGRGECAGFPIDDRRAAVVLPDHVAEPRIAPGERDRRIVGRVRIEPVERVHHHRMVAAGQLAHAVVAVQIELHPHRWLARPGDVEPVEADVPPVELVDRGHRVDAAVDHPLALGRRRFVVQEARRRIARNVRRDLALDEAHREEGAADHVRIGLVAVHRRNRCHTGRLDAAHDAVLQTDRDIARRTRLDRKEPGVARLDPRDQPLAALVAVLAVGRREEDRLVREACRARHVYVVNPQIRRIGPLLLHPGVERIAKALRIANGFDGRDVLGHRFPSRTDGSAQRTGSARPDTSVHCVRSPPQSRAAAAHASQPPASKLARLQKAVRGTYGRIFSGASPLSTAARKPRSRISSSSSMRSES
jgi:hypothetical protein